jgi:opacity protein-like surface antigen
MRKLIIIAASLAALAVPTAAMATQPVNPGGFGQDRAAWIHANSGAEWGVIAGERAGDNGTINHDYMAANGDLPVESSLTTP